mgnify:FL=1
MAITDRDVVDSVAYEDSILLLQLYDHLDFEGEFEKDHMLMSVSYTHLTLPTT